MGESTSIRHVPGIGTVLWSDPELRRQEEAVSAEAQKMEQAGEDPMLLAGLQEKTNALSILNNVMYALKMRKVSLPDTEIAVLANLPQNTQQEQRNAYVAQLQYGDLINSSRAIQSFVDQALKRGELDADNHQKYTSMIEGAIQALETLQG